MYDGTCTQIARRVCVARKKTERNSQRDLVYAIHDATGIRVARANPSRVIEISFVVNDA